MSPACGATVCVIGGGLSGIAAALRLVDRGAQVTLLESRPRLGGATYSFARGELAVDTGQHVFLRCFDQYRRLLQRLGTEAHTTLQDRFSVPVAAGGRLHWLQRSRLPAPAHLLPALLRYRLLNPAERWAAARAAAALRHVDPDDSATDLRSFGDWLAAHGQSRGAVSRLWDLIAVAALNATTDEASLALAARVFQAGLLAQANAGDIGWAKVSLQQLHAQPAQQLLGRLGAQVHTRTKVCQVRPDRHQGGFQVDLDDASLWADAVVLAVPHRVASWLLPPAAAPLGAPWQQLGSSPIVNVHLRYATPVTTLDMVAAVDSPAQWIFDRTVPGLTGQHLVVSLSAADAQLTQPSAQLIATQRAAMGRLFPAAGHTAVTEAFVTREPHATFRQAPGSARWRPAPRTAMPGLALAGAWTATGWPDTMEGAVRSGYAAANVISSHLAHRFQPMEAAQ